MSTSIKTGYTTPKLFSYNGDLKKEWYVGFRMSNELGLRKAFQIRLGINYCKTKATRIAEGNAVVEIINKALADGWDPFSTKIEEWISNPLKAEIDASPTTIYEALLIAYANKEPYLAHKSKQNILSVLDFFNTALQQLQLDQMPIADISRKHIKAALDRIGINRQNAYNKEGKGRKFTGNSYNKYRNLLSLLFTELEELEYIQYNPCAKIKNKAEIRTNIHRHATAQERKIIIDYLSSKMPNLLFYLSIIHGTGIRPKEIFALKISDIDHLNKCFIIKGEAEKNKTKITRRIAIPEKIYQTLINHIASFPRNYRIFSNNYMPGEELKRADYATKHWRKFIKEGLGINVSMYSFKGLGGVDKRNAGIDIGAISAQYGHTSTDMTMIYLHGEQDRINKELIEKTPTLI